jgi:hypothetical protein
VGAAHQEDIVNQIQATDQHWWLRKLIGRWTYEHPHPAADGQPGQVLRGVEQFRAIGPLWVQGEATGPMPDGGEAISLMTLGFDPATKRFVGTWVGSVMPNLWVYDGELDANGKTLRLYSNGPAMDGSSRTEPYMDVIEFITDDHRTLTGHTRADDGTWKAFMEGHYRRQR